VSTGGDTALNNIAQDQQWKAYAGKLGKAASTYQGASGVLGGQQQGVRAPPQGRPIFQGGQQQPIAQQQQAPQENQFAQYLLEQRLRQRGMLG
jgi:hypothetical protein